MRASCGEARVTLLRQFRIDAESYIRTFSNYYQFITTSAIVVSCRGNCCRLERLLSCCTLVVHTSYDSIKLDRARRKDILVIEFHSIYSNFSISVDITCKMSDESSVISPIDKSLGWSFEYDIRLSKVYLRQIMTVRNFETLDGLRRWWNIAGELWKCREKIVNFRNVLPERLKISEVEDFWNWRNDMATGHEGKESPRYYSFDRYRYHTNNQMF